MLDFLSVIISPKLHEEILPAMSGRHSLILTCPAVILKIRSSGPGTVEKPLMSSHVAQCHLSTRKEITECGLDFVSAREFVVLDVTSSVTNNKQLAKTTLVETRARD